MATEYCLAEFCSRDKFSGCLSISFYKDVMVLTKPEALELHLLDNRGKYPILLANIRVLTIFLVDFLGLILHFHCRVQICLRRFFKGSNLWHCYLRCRRLDILVLFPLYLSKN